ncbi:tRNA modification 82 [Hibiscus trionum]|uniref:tRNA (guanine-N(7)-)-methyltransferase non-catalytic subunit n=1 Tax=Hibiscus trionum TaxID=183268 RepID=A0A9W7IN47_HIBTR|nr:tRNA modification 82 [Hibiscus trionum]
MEGAKMDARVEDDSSNTQEDAPMEESEQNNKDTEASPALISVHPTQNSVAVAVGSDLRVFNLLDDCAVSLTEESGGAYHNDSIRCIKYGTNGKLFVSAGDDKLVKVWSTDCWRCISTVVSEKRVSAVAISNDDHHICFADKFGVVWVVDLPGVDGTEASSFLNKKAVPLLAHYCSIITSLEFSPDGRFIVSADRDFKIRVTVFPKKPLDGAHEIQSFCLGHTEFVSCLAFISTPDSPQGILVSGGGDSTVRMWDIISGSLLDTCEVGTKVEQVESDATEGNCSTVTDICTIAECTLIAVAIQSLRGIMLLTCDLPSRTLSVTKVVSIVGENFVPTSIGSSISGGLLWMVTGASKLRGSDVSSLSRVKVISGFKKSSPNTSEQEPTVLADGEIPGRAKLLEKLQGSISIDEKVFLAAADAVKTAMCNLLIKKQYSDEKREFRKRTRNDKKNKQ